MKTEIKPNTHSKRGAGKILESPSVFNFWQKITGGEKWKSRIMKEYIKPFHGARILDVGCGTGSVLNYIDKNTTVDYIGCDINQNYICQARKKFGGKGTFYCCDVNNLPTEESDFDILLAIAIFHHLTDETSAKLIDSIKRKLKPGGVFFLAEPVWTEHSSRLEKYLMKNDRGKNIKTENGYRTMLSDFFSSIKSTIVCDSHFIPWTVNVITCKNPLGAAPTI